MIVLDTHVLLWSQFERKHIGRKSIAILERAWQHARVAIPTIAFWEIGMLIERGRVSLHTSLEAWRFQLVQGGLLEFSLTSEIAIRALDFASLHADPADRFIAATALVQNATLITADEKLLDWRHALPRQDARE